MSAPPRSTARRERVLVATTSYPAHEGDPSGHFVRAEARRLARQGAAVTVLAPGGSRGSVEKDELCVEVRRLGGGSLFAWPGVVARLGERPSRGLVAPLVGAAALREVLRTRGMDRAIAHWIVPSALPLLATRMPLEVVAHGADVRLLVGAPSPFRVALLSALADRDTRFRFVATALAKALLESLPPSLAARIEQRSRVEPCAIDVPDRSTLPDPRLPDPRGDFARENRSRNGIDRNESSSNATFRDASARDAATGDHRNDKSSDFADYVVWVGRLVGDKRPALALEVAARAGVHLVVIGDGPLAAERDPERATLLGALPRDEALRWIAHARALLVTSRTEGAPTVVREARALGVPVVTTDVGDVAAWARSDASIAIASDERLARVLHEVVAR